MEDNKKEALLKATMELLQQADRPEAITSRQIAARAGANIALINYYFGSKKNLEAQAVGELLNEASKLFQTPPNRSEPPKERLRHILKQICEVVLKYQRYTKLYVPQLLLEDEITVPLYVLPEIREHFGGRRSDTECRIIAYEMVSFLQLAFYRSDAFLRYAGMNLTDVAAANWLVDWELALFLPEDMNS